MLFSQNLQIANVEEICIIDDDPMALILAEKIFEYEIPDIAVKCFENADGALEHLNTQKNKKRLIFVDLYMPGKDGWFFLENYKSEPGKDIIFILSSSDDETDKKRVKTFTQVTDFLEKPITIKKVIELKNTY